MKIEKPTKRDKVIYVPESIATPFRALPYPKLSLHPMGRILRMERANSGSRTEIHPYPLGDPSFISEYAFSLRALVRIKAILLKSPCPHLSLLS